MGMVLVDDGGERERRLGVDDGRCFHEGKLFEGIIGHGGRARGIIEGVWR